MISVVIMGNIMKSDYCRGRKWEREREREREREIIYNMTDKLK